MSQSLSLSAPPLQQLARLHGVQTSYYDLSGNLQRASPEALESVLRALGAPLEGKHGLEEALESRRRELWESVLPPVVVIWDGRSDEIRIRLPSRLAERAVDIEIQLESGETLAWSCNLDSLPAAGRPAQPGGTHLVRHLELPRPLPFGYHKLRLTIGKTTSQHLVISAPGRTYDPLSTASDKTWGLFAPLYAIHKREGWPVGDFSDLNNLTQWTASMGGGIVATLPMLDCFLDHPAEPSPYAPASRLFWNPFYIDPTDSEEYEQCPEARVAWSAAVSSDLARGQAQSRNVDFEGLSILKRRVLECLADHFFEHGGADRPAYQRFLNLNPECPQYARFRACREDRGQPWRDWPEKIRGGLLAPTDVNPSAIHYHQYVQWLAHLQLEMLSKEARRHGPGLYLDLPLGVHPDGYDAWRYQNDFAQGVTAGAPPDGFFTLGQNWGFSPLHPERVCESGYEYVRACIRNHLQYAGMLRLDHIMGLHRLFWIPEGMEAREGVYVRAHPEELYAILALESHRHRSLIIGEDLGTVSPRVRNSMARHGVKRLYVGQFSMHSDSAAALEPPPTASVASLNTHDLPPFAAFWEGLDIADRRALGLLSSDQERAEQEQRGTLRNAVLHFLVAQGWLQDGAHDTWSVMKACSAHLAAGPARMVLFNLEDLWLETRPQNTPGTSSERVNWRRRARLSQDEFSGASQIVNFLVEMNRLRRGE